MIGYLSGAVVADRIVSVAGVGYLVHTPHPLTVGEPATLWVHTAVSENAITLYGCPSPAELSLFTALCAVTGVGPKMGLALLRDLGPAAVVAAVRDGNVKALCKAAGVGPKVAARLVSECKMPPDAAALAEGAPAAAPAPTGPAAELAATLMNLGYPAQAAESAAVHAVESTGSQDEATLLTAALAALRETAA